MAKSLSLDSDADLTQVQPLSERPTLEEGAYHGMRRAITDGILLPGDRISVNAMAQQLGVSRLPVIHALRRLASEGFVEIHPHKNVTVSKPTPKEVRVRMLMMIAAEEIAVREAWPLSKADLDRMTEIYELSRSQIAAGIRDEETDWRFHEVVWQASGVEQLRAQLQTLWDLGAYYRSVGYKTYGVLNYRMDDHAAILRAFHSDTPDEAVAAIRAHRLRALDRLNALFTAAAALDATPSDEQSNSANAADRTDTSLEPASERAALSIT